VHLFDRLGADDYEQVVYCHDRPTGLRAIVAIHSTALGPALGGTRFYPYPTENDALEDVLRLARAMTYKAAAAGLDLGGGKAVILGDPARDKSEGLLRAYGRFIESLGGRYITAEDVGTTQADMDVILRETRHVTGVSPSLGGSGDPSPPTAFGVYWAMKAVVAHLTGDASLAGRHIVVSGVGKVGSALVHHLAEDGATITAADVDERALERVRQDVAVDVVPPEKAHAVACDVFSPCALGGALNEATIPELRCAAVVGAANNQLSSPADADALARAGVLYAPDFIVNAGGVINVAEELDGYDRERSYARVRHIFAAISTVLATAEAEGLTPAEAAAHLAERRIRQLGRLQQIRTSRRGLR
jgi:glutamate dehydrogenase/leucine dehydrogenase